MSKGSFSSGFLLGALLGGAIGGAIGAAAVTQSREGRTGGERKPIFKAKRRDRDAEPAIEATDPDMTRRELEAKIARLNDTIDDVREQLYVVHERVPSVEAEHHDAALDEVQN